MGNPINQPSQQKAKPIAPRQWPGETIALVASGPSLKPEDVNYLRGKCRVIVINDNYRLAPWADVLYACDADWWEHHQGCPSFEGQRWTQAYGQNKARSNPAGATRQLKIIEKYKLRHIHGEYREGISLMPDLIHYGGNSGFQAMNLAVHFGARRILLLGYDMNYGALGKTHWFGDHPPGLNRASNYNDFRTAFESAAPGLYSAGIEVINCSKETALKCFPRALIQDVL